jgi:hypothetical protein
MMTNVILYITLLMLVRYLIWCYLFMTIYIGIAAFRTKRISRYHVYIWLTAPISTPYHLLLMVASFLTNLDDDSSDN